MRGIIILKSVLVATFPCDRLPEAGPAGAAFVLRPWTRREEESTPRRRMSRRAFRCLTGWSQGRSVSSSKSTAAPAGESSLRHSALDFFSLGTCCSSADSGSLASKRPTSGVAARPSRFQKALMSHWFSPVLGNRGIKPAEYLESSCKISGYVSRQRGGEFPQAPISTS